MLAPTDNATDIEQVLGMFDAANDIVFQEGTYTFFRQSMDAKKYISHGPHKLYFRTVGGLLYLMQYPRNRTSISMPLLRARRSGPHHGWNLLEHGQPRRGALIHDVQGLS
jgi:hypothetical protein